jgi:hypothetical protein
MAKRFVICINNEGLEVSLERNKIYYVLPDKQAEKQSMIRIIDESGEDYLHGINRFIEIAFPKNIEKQLLAIK